MLHIQTQARQVPILQEDLAMLFQLNPLALEQLKGIALERAFVASQAELAAVQGDSAEEERANGVGELADIPGGQLAR